MALSDIRQRTAVLFIAVMLGHILLISAQVNSKSGVPILEAVTFGAFSEVQRAASSLTGGAHNAWTGYVNLRGVRAENQQLKVKTLAAEVIGAGASLDFRTATINKGSSDGLKTNMPVIAPTGLVGRIVTLAPRAAKIQLLVDRNFGAGALVERSRAQGVVLGSGEDLLKMEYVADVADVKQGDTIVTAGVDGLYPKGLVIGKVESIDKGNGIYKVIKVRPATDFNRLEDVLVVTTPTEAAPAEGVS